MESQIVLHARIRRIYLLGLVWFACAFLFVSYLWLSGPRSPLGLFMLGFMLVMVAAGFWKVSDSINAIPASITINETELSFSHSSGLGKQMIESYELSRIKDLRTTAKGSRVRNLTMEMMDGERRILRQIDAGTALDVERLYRKYKD